LFRLNSIGRYDLTSPSIGSEKTKFKIHVVCELVAVYFLYRGFNEGCGAPFPKGIHGRAPTPHKKVESRSLEMQFPAFWASKSLPGLYLSITVYIN